MSPAPHRPVVLCILDGVGIGGGAEDDAVATARTPNLDRLWESCPHLKLKAHGKAVGLPSDADMGNSEVGHNAMGAGRVIDQGASLVNQAIASGGIFQSQAWAELVACPTLHLIGLVSDGNVHSHVDHLRALIDGAARHGVRRIRVHALTDGRDVSARSALTWILPLQEHLATLPDAAIASGGGRMRITMDRYQADWSMVQRGWDVHVRGIGRMFPSASDAITTLYSEDPLVDDQWLPPFVIGDPADPGAPIGRIGDGDAVLLFNFRGDRAIELSQAFEADDLPQLDRHPRPRVTYAGMMQYDGDLKVPARYLVTPPLIDDTVGIRLAAAGRRTFACSETQKFGHVTYFFNGNRSGLIDPDLERYVEVPSDVRPFEQAPWMKAAEITDRALDALAEGTWDHIRLNYPNGDMVGHTGYLEATRVAVEAVDLQLGRLIPAVRAAGGLLIVTADHGNADTMWQRDRQGVPVPGANGAPLPLTSHTLNPVPFLLVDDGAWEVRDDLVDPGIASIASTLLQLLDVPIPEGWLPPLLRPRADVQERAAGLIG